MFKSFEWSYHTDRHQYYNDFSTRNDLYAYFFQYFSGAADTNKTLTASLKGAGTIEGASGGIISFTLSRGNAWEGFSFTITGADATTRVVFAPAVKSKNRVQFDNFRAESLTR